MKKVFVSILAIIYLSTSMGATVHMHYCMGRLVSWGLADRTGKTCDFCGMQKMGSTGDCVPGVKNCCHEESKQLKNDKDQKAGQDFFQVTKITPAMAESPRPLWVNRVAPSIVVSFPIANGPPPAGTTPVFLRNCNFRI